MVVVQVELHYDLYYDLYYDLHYVEGILFCSNIITMKFMEYFNS